MDPCTYPSLDPKILSKFQRQREEVQKFHPTLKIASNIQQTKRSLNRKFLKEGSNPQFCPSLRNFTNNSITMEFTLERIMAWERILHASTQIKNMSSLVSLWVYSFDLIQS